MLFLLRLTPDYIKYNSAMAQLLMKCKKEHLKKEQGLWFMKGFVGIGGQLLFTKTLALPAAYIYSISMKTPNSQN